MEIFADWTIARFSPAGRVGDPMIRMPIDRGDTPVSNDKTPDVFAPFLFSSTTGAV